MNIDRRFKWSKIHDKHFLFLNLKESSEEEKIAAIYRLTYYGNHIPETAETALLVVRYDLLYENESVLNHLVSYFKRNSRFKRIAFYGDSSELLLASVKLINREIIGKAGLFATRKEAIQYALQS